MFASLSPKHKLIVYIVLAFFALVYASISLVNHYVFRTNGYDLGIYNQILYSYAHFKISLAPIQQPLINHIYADHFEPIFMVFAPFYFLFGSYTLLVIQIALVIGGATGILIYSLHVSKNPVLSIAIMLQFLGMWGIYSALSFDFHNNVTAAMLVPWLLVFTHKQDWPRIIITWLLMLACKENMALFTAFILAGLAIHHFKNNLLRNRLLLLSFFSLIYVVIIIGFVIPAHMIPGKDYLYKGMYEALGNTKTEILSTLLFNPLKVFHLLFNNQLSEPIYDGIKKEFHMAVLYSGGFFLLLRPQFLMMLIPIYAQKLFINDPQKWGINYHYSIEVIPIICAATISVINNHSILLKWYKLIMLLIIGSTFYFTFTKIKSRKSVWYDSIGVAIYKKEHYISALEIAEANAVLATLTDEESISAQSNLVPHLAGRDTIYMYPKVENARYILLAPDTYTYPLSKEELLAQLEALKQSTEWNLQTQKGGVYIFKRK
jgi:uncharacterized membrane protein